NIDSNVEWVSSIEPEPQAENNENLVFEEVDLEDFDSKIDSDEDEAERRKALRKLDTPTCLQSRTVRKCTSSFLSREIEETIKPNPKILLSTLKEQLKKKYEIGVSKQKVFREKQMAEHKVHGDHITQYTQLRQYVLELKEKNPDTTVKINVERDYEPDSMTRQFRRMYVCLGALKSGFKAGKRDLLGLDGCFMSGPFPMQILTAVGVDPNYGIYPLAYAIVESENKQAWLWFLDCLGDDLELFKNSNFTFVTDRQKGLIPALEETFPVAEHRYCLKHIYDNMKLQWRGQQFKDLLWKCATATTVSYFNRNMKELKCANKELYDWLKLIPAQHWERSYFSARPHCDVLLNNICEVLNRQLKDGRDKPIITCLEFIREYPIKRIVIVQQVISKSNGPLTPKATKKVGFDMYALQACSRSNLEHGRERLGTRHTRIMGTRNDKERVRAECRGIVPCFSKKRSGLSYTKKKTKKKTKKGSDIKKKVVKYPWLLHCVKPKGQSSWYCRVFKDTHTCLQSRTVRKCTSSFLSREIKETIKPNLKIPLIALKEQLQKKYEIGVSKQKVFRAKQMAEHKVHGDHITQYTQLRQYVLELKERNPDTTVKIDVERDYEPDSMTRQFRRIYVCLGALKSGCWEKRSIRPGWVFYVWTISNADLNSCRCGSKLWNISFGIC
nr:transposase, mutator type [Tanacetum cinerariifolium]